MKKLWLGVLVVLLAGCQPQHDLGAYKCSEEEMKKAQTEARWCADNTTFFSSHCFTTAVQRNCAKKETGK